MKKNLLKLILVIFIMTFSCISWQMYRYHINSPMLDIEYKKAILRDSHNYTYTLEALRPLMGPEELTQFIKDNNDNPQIYTPSIENIKSGKFRANLHMHTTMSDGITTVQKRMDDAEKYAKEKIDGGKMVIAITDHNTVLGAKEIIKVLEKGKNKYNDIKVVPGMEIFTHYQNSKFKDSYVDIHVLLWSINPYDKFLNEEFYKEKLKDKWNYKDRDFDWVIETMSKHGIVGIAHPARYTSAMKEKKYPYITEMLTRYNKLNSSDTKFVEGYYQSYMQTGTGEHLGSEYDKYINHINNEAKKLGIIRTGSTDAHGYSIFRK